MSDAMRQDAAGEAVAADWTADWMADLGEHAGLVAAKGWTSPAEVVKSYAHLERLVGGDRIAVPKAGDDEGFRAAMRRMGAPEEAKGYELAAPRDLPKDWYRADAADSFRALAHKASLTPAQARVLHDGWIGTLMEAEQRQAAASHQAQAKLEQDLRAEWAGDYDQKLELARRAARHFGDAAELDALESAIGSPALLRLFARIGDHFGEDTLVGQGDGRFAASAGEAREEIATLKRDPDFMAALASDGHLGHADAKAKWRRLHETAYPGWSGREAEAGAVPCAGRGSMCEVTLALTIASTVASAIGTIQQANSQATANRHNAAIYERNAVLARQQAAAEARRIRDAGARALGRQRVAFSAAGIAVEGTPLDVLGDTAADIELDALTARYGGEVEAADYLARASALRWQAAATRRQALYGAGTSLLLDAGRAFNRTYGQSTTAAPTSTLSSPANRQSMSTRR